MRKLKTFADPLFVVRNKVTKEIHITSKLKWVYWSVLSAKNSFLSDEATYWGPTYNAKWELWADEWEVVEIDKPTVKDTP